jgi:hypothetical protein
MCIYVVCFLLCNSPASEFYMPTFRNTICSLFIGNTVNNLFIIYFIMYLLAYEDETDSVPKRRHIKFRRRGITQKKTYNIQNTAKV